MRSKAGHVALVARVQVLVLSPWFFGTAAGFQALLTSAVQAGFVRARWPEPCLPCPTASIPAGSSPASTLRPWLARRARRPLPGLLGTMLTVQTSLGFTLTPLTIQLVAAMGRGGAFTLLANGPALGCLAMLRLRRGLQAS